jgi:hypothetical protein
LEAGRFASPAQLRSEDSRWRDARSACRQDRAGQGGLPHGLLASPSRHCGTAEWLSVAGSLATPRSRCPLNRSTGPSALAPAQRAGAQRLCALTHKRHKPNQKKLRFHSPARQAHGLTAWYRFSQAALAGEGHVRNTIQRRELIAVAAARVHVALVARATGGGPTQTLARN